jgi:hypothetical protein
MKVSVVDVIVIALIGLSLFSFSTKYEPKYEFEYSGSQIYKVVRECDILDSTGFLYTVFVKGYWNYDIGHFEQEGVVVSTGRGYIEIVLHDGREVTVGGKMSYKEDIQAVDITIQLKSKSSVIYLLRPSKGLRSDIASYIEKSAGFIDYLKEDIAVTCVLTLDADTRAGIKPSITLEAELEDILRKEIFFMKKADVEVYDDGVTVAVERLSMKEFERIFEILERYFVIEEMYTGDIEVFYQTAEEIDDEDVLTLESHTEEDIHPGSIHVRV